MSLPTVTLPSGERVPRLGQGTWRMGEERHHFKEEVAALRLGMDLGMTLIDTAEMYGEGGAEEVVAEAISGRHDEVFIVSKVYPHNASQQGAIAACERSLKRLRTEQIDLYLLHWRGTFPLAETVEAFEKLATDGKIRYWGVSNFDTRDMRELYDLPSGQNVATNQVLYNLSRRGIEWELLPWCEEHRIPLMAYSPIEQGALLGDATLKKLAARHEATPAQVALAWLLRRENVITIPKAVRPEHIRDNIATLDLRLSEADLEAMDGAFPPPHGPVALETI
jgi:diketogulonate reductase-like aldo/keto reductase